MFGNFFFLRKSFRLWENVENCRADQATWQYGACALHAGYLRLQTHTLILCNTHCLPTATTFARPRLNATTYLHFLLLYKVNIFCTSLWCVLHVASLRLLPMFSWQFHSRRPVPSLWDFRFWWRFSRMTHSWRNSAVDCSHSNWRQSAVDCSHSNWRNSEADCSHSNWRHSAADCSHSNWRHSAADRSHSNWRHSAVDRSHSITFHTSFSRVECKTCGRTDWLRQLSLSAFIWCNLQ
jgi:hypothetical protein